MQTNTYRLHHFKSYVGYASDVEGNLEYWNTYIKTSKVINKDQKGDIYLKDYCHFVYGGDVCDRGPGDLRVMADLVKLKENYPDRVHLILGNRDINKLRIPFSLHSSMLSAFPKVYWLKTEENVYNYKLNDKDCKLKWVNNIGIITIR